MATQPAAKTNSFGRTIRYTWSNLAQGDDGIPISIPGAADRSVQVTGTFNGASVIIEGTLEETPINYFTLTDMQGNPISFSAVGGELISEMVTHIRPRISGGGASTDLVVILLNRATM